MTHGCPVCIRLVRSRLDEALQAARVAAAGRDFHARRRNLGG